MDIQVSTVPAGIVWLHTRQTGARGSSRRDFCSKGVTGQMRALNLKWHHFDRLAFRPPAFIQTAALEQRGCSQQVIWQKDRRRSALPQQLKAAVLHNDTAVSYKNRTTQPTTPSCKLKLVLWKTETRHAPDGYVGISNVHNGSLL